MKTTVWLLIAAALVAAGILLFVLVMGANQWDFLSLDTNPLEPVTYLPEETFHSILVETDTTDLFLLPAKDGGCKVVCDEDKKEPHLVSVESGTLTVRRESDKKWYEHIGISFRAPKVTVYLPKAAFHTLTVRTHTGNVEIAGDFTFETMDIKATTGHVNNYASVNETMVIETDTGDIHTENISVGSLALSVNTGKITAAAVRCREDVTVHVTTGDAVLTAIACRNLYSDGDTGNLFLRNVIAAGQFSISRDTGDVTFDDCDAEELSVRTDTGDVTGSLLSDKIFIAETDTGRVNVPSTTNGGICRITTDTGDITVTIQ